MGAAMTMGIANIVTSARNRRSRTSRRLVDSPRTFRAARSSSIAMAPWGHGRGRNAPFIARAHGAADGDGGTAGRRTNGSVRAEGPRPEGLLGSDDDSADPANH